MEPEAAAEPGPAPRSEPASTSAAADKEEDTKPEKHAEDAPRKAVASALEARKQAAAAESTDSVGKEEAMSRRDFVRHLLTLIHTDSEFVDRLYDDYLKEVAGG